MAKPKYYEFWVNHDRKKEEYFESDEKAIKYGKRYVLSNNTVNIYRHEATRVLVASWKNDKRIK